MKQNRNIRENLFVSNAKLIFLNNSLIKPLATWDKSVQSNMALISVIYFSKASWIQFQNNFFLSYTDAKIKNCTYFQTPIGAKEETKTKAK